MKLPDTLRDRIDRFRHRGHVPAYRDGLFGPTSWQAVFVGQGIVPQAADRLADILPDAVLAERLDALSATIAYGVQSARDHAAFVSDYCPAPAP